MQKEALSAVEEALEGVTSAGKGAGEEHPAILLNPGMLLLFSLNVKTCIGCFAHLVLELTVFALVLSFCVMFLISGSWI